MAKDNRDAWDRETFESRLRALGSRYHIHHPFQVKMNQGELNREQIQGWVANRYYYQISIPLKDSALMANCPERAVRRRWTTTVTRMTPAESRHGSGLVKAVDSGAKKSFPSRGYCPESVLPWTPT